MKIDIIIVFIAVVAAVVVPYVIFVLFGSSAKRNRQKRFSEVVKKENLSLDQVDLWNANIMGLDKTHQKILFYQQRRESEFIQLIDLRNVKSSLVFSEEQTSKMNKKNEKILEKVFLELQLNSGEKQYILLYDCDQTFYQDYELRNAEKWNRLINEIIQVRLHVHSAA